MEQMLSHISESHPGAKCLLSESVINPNVVSSESNQKLEETDRLSVVYSCGYCSMESRNENLVIDHIKKKHKATDVGKIRKHNTEQTFYCCSHCEFKASDVESLTKHGQSAHRHSFITYKRIKLVEYILVDDIEDCVTCLKSNCVCGIQYTPINAPNGYHNCPQCDFICPTYDECLNHFEKHYFKFGCRVCVAKFITKEEFQEHHKARRHPANFKVLEPDTNTLEEYKMLILIKRNGKWETTNRMT